MGRPPKFVTKSGRPLRRLGERRLKSSDDTGRVHALGTIQEACAVIHCSAELFNQLVSSGVVRTVGADSEVGPRLYSLDDAKAVAAQLFDEAHPSAEVAVGLKSAPAEQK